MRTIVVVLLYVILAILLLPVLFICYLGRWPNLIIIISRWALKLGEKILGVQLEVSGLENIDKKSAYVFMANHLSFLDGPLLFMLIPQPVRVILKKEAFRLPVIGQGMRQLKFIPVDRKKLRGGRRSIDRAARLIKEKGFSFLIFPEGTRSRDGKIQTFKRGGFFLAVNSQVPIVPISIKGTYELMPRGSFFVKKGKIKVVFHPPFVVTGYNKNNFKTLMEKIKEIIRSGLEPDNQEIN